MATGPVSSIVAHSPLGGANEIGPAPISPYEPATGDASTCLVALRQSLAKGTMCIYATNIRNLPEFMNLFIH